MTESDTPSLVFRKTSLTARERFTPARACSTLTRMRANFRFVRFCTAVSSPRGGFFFRLAGLCPRWLVPLESRVLVQDRAGRIGDPFLVGDPLVVRPAGVGPAQEADALALGVHHDHVLVGVCLPLAGVVGGLFLRVFWPLPPPIRAVDDEPSLWAGGWRVLGELAGVPLGEGPDLAQGLTQDGQEPVNPVVGPGLTEAEEFAQQRLQGVCLE